MAANTVDELAQLHRKKRQLAIELKQKREQVRQQIRELQKVDTAITSQLDDIADGQNQLFVGKK